MIKPILNDPTKEVLDPFLDKATDILGYFADSLPTLKCSKDKRPLRSLFHLCSLLGDLTQSTALSVSCPLKTFTLVSSVRPLLGTTVWQSQQPDESLHLDV